MLKREKSAGYRKWRNARKTKLRYSVVVLPQPNIAENSVLTEPNIWGPNWALNVSNCKRVELGLGNWCYLLFMLLEQTIKKEISSIKRSLRFCHCRAPSQNEIAKLFFSGHKREPQHHDTLFYPLDVTPIYTYRCLRTLSQTLYLFLDAFFMGEKLPLSH